MAVVALCALPLPAAAQRVVISYSPDTGFTAAAPVTRSLNLTTGLVEWTEPGGAVSPVTFTADGRLVVYRRTDGAAMTRLALRDVITGATASVPVDFEPLAALPTDTALFGLTGVQSTLGTSSGTLARLDAAGVQQMAGCPGGATVEFDVSVDGRTIAARCQSGDIAIVDIATNQTRHMLTANAGAPVVSLRAGANGAHVFVIRRPSATSHELAVVDAVSGLTLSSAPFGPADATCRFVAIAPDRTRAVTSCITARPPSFADVAQVVDLATLTAGPTLPGYVSVQAVFSPDGREVFMSSRHRLGFGQLARHDADTGDITLSSGIISPGAFAVSFSPLAPALTATVNGRSVDLQWTLPAHSPAATGYVLEIGTAPGLSDLGTMAVEPGLALSVPGAPPGTYVVRLRAMNAVGPGAVSNEVTVVVP